MSISAPYISVGANRSSSCAARNGAVFAYGAGRLVALWDLDSGHGVFATLTGHQGRVTVVKTCGAGFVSGDDAGGVRVWAQHGTKVAGAVSALAVWGDELLVGGSDGAVSRIRSAGPVDKLDLGGKIALDMEVVVLPGSSTPLLVIGATDRKVQLWTEQAGTGHEDWVRCVAAAPSGGDVVLATGSQDSYIRLWRIVRADGGAGGAAGAGAAPGLDMLDELERLAAEGSTQISTRAHVLSVDGARYHISLDALLVGHEGGLTNVRWAPARAGGPAALLSSSADNSLIIWTPTPAASAAAALAPAASRDGVWVPAHRFGTFGGRGLGFFGAVWGEGGRSVIATGWNGGVERWERVSGGEPGDEWASARGLTGHHGEVRAVAWEPNGDYLLSASTDQTARVHARATGSWAEIARPQIHGYDMADAAWLSPLRFASAADEKVTRVFDATAGFAGSVVGLGVSDEVGDTSGLPRGATVPPLGLSNRALGKESTQPEIKSAGNVARDVVPAALAAIPTEDELAGATLWPEAEKVYGHGYELSTLAARPGGGLLATAARATAPEHAAVRLVDAATWDTAAVLPGHALTVTRIAWAPAPPDAQAGAPHRVLTVSRDRGWRLYAGAGSDWAEVARRERAHARMVLDACWASDGARFFTAGRDKAVRLWRADTGAELGAGGGGSAGALVVLEHGVTAVDACAAPPGDAVGGAGADQLLAVGDESGRVAVYAVAGETATLVVVVPDELGHVAAVNRLAWRPLRPGRAALELASASDDGSVRVFEVRLDG